jgi:hypothetical protein
MEEWWWNSSMHSYPLYQIKVNVRFTRRTLYFRVLIPKYPLDRRLCGPKTDLQAVARN